MSILVVEYVNKSNRGMIQLYRELIKLHEEFPDCDTQQLLTKLGLRVLNSIEMSAQEADELSFKVRDYGTYSLVDRALQVEEVQVRPL